MKQVLCAWLLTAGLGGYFATVWIRHGGPAAAHVGVTRLPLWLVVGHLVPAVAGLACWTAYLAGAVRSTAWAACAVVLVVAAFGLGAVPGLVGQGWSFRAGWCGLR